MDMESTRRPFDRSKEPGLKKPRLAEETQRVPNPNSNGRPFAQRPAGNNPVQSRSRVSDRDSENNDSLRGGYHSQPPHHELVSQYKTALAELTFNSKPIITNLTIIAGENLPVAKAIAATICANILEVPIEQKLPSLYLLDSIVKNIGRDYIKYFATKLPEVFCKAYRQVDPAVHPSMRHLFGTWKGVFPPQSLQMIEKELGFATAVNGSSTGSTNSKPDSQTHCPPHSIHVNPKYLERQRLQQPSRTKGMATDISGPAINSLEDSERLDKATSVGRPWVDPSIKMHNMRSHRDAISERIHEKNIRSESNDYNYISDIPKSPGSEILKTGRRVMEQGYNKPWYGGGSSVAEPITSQRNGLNIKQGFQNHSALKSTNADPNLQTAPNIANKSSGVMSSSWKNSDEEEFMWDDMNSRLTDHSASDVSSSLKKHHWTTDDSDKLGFEDFEKPPIVHDYSSNKDFAALGNQVSPPWSLQKSNSMDVSNQSRTPMVRDHPALSRSSTIGNSSLARMGGRPPMVASSHVGGSSFGFPTNTTTGSVEAPVQRRLQSLGAGSSSELLLMSQHSPLPRSTLNHPHHQFQSSTEQDPSESKSFDYADSKASHFSGKLHKETQNPYSQESPVVSPSNVQLHSMEKSQLQGIKASSPSVPPFRPRHPYTSAHQEDSPLSDPFDEIQKSPLPHISDIGTFSTSNSSPNSTNPLSAEITRESNTSSLLAAVMKSGILNSNSISSSLPNLNFQETKKLSSQTGYIPLSTGPSLSSCYNSSAVPEINQNKVGQPPALTSLSLSVGASGDASDVVNNGPHPISNLLSSLVAKGLICASKTELPTVLSTQVPKESKRESPEITITGTVPDIADPFVSSIVLSTKNDAIPSEPPAAKTPVIMPPSSKLKTKNVIGFEFKSDVLRKFHPSVIDDLLNDSPHLCSKCGLKFKFQEQFNRHLEWHSIKKSEAVEVSRRWYVDSSDWISGKAGLSLGFESAKSVEKPGQTKEKGELMVPADEIQCACVLCGEIFEDFYCQERDEWMFKGAVYMTIPSGAGDKGSTSEVVVKGPIVHANCISESSLLDLGLVACVKMEEDA